MTSELATVLAYHQYVGGADSQTVYTTHHYCGSCRRQLASCYGFPKYPEELEAENEQRFVSWEPDERPLDYFSFCPWCGVEFEEEWWKDRTIQNERAIDHYRDPGTHKGDTHEFRGEGLDCMANHWLAVSGGDQICWCDPEVEPGLMGCVIRHQDKSYEDFIAAERAAVASDDWEDE